MSHVNVRGPDVAESGTAQMEIAEYSNQGGQDGPSSGASWRLAQSPMQGDRCSTLLIGLMLFGDPKTRRVGANDQVRAYDNPGHQNKDRTVPAEDHSGRPYG